LYPALRHHLLFEPVFGFLDLVSFFVKFPYGLRAGNRYVTAILFKYRVGIF